MSTTEIPACSHCGAQLQVQPGVTQATCHYCGNTSMLGNAAAPQQPPQPGMGQPPMPQGHPQQMPYGMQQPQQMQGQVPNYASPQQASNLGKKITLMVLGFVVLILGGVGFFVYKMVSGVQSTVAEATAGIPDTSDFDVPSAGAGAGNDDSAGGPDAPSTTKSLYGKGAPTIPEILEFHLDEPIRVRKLTINSERGAEVIVKRPSGNERHSFSRNGGLMDRGGGEHNENEPFRLSDADFGVLETVLDKAVEERGNPNLSPSYVVLERNDEGKLLWRVKFGTDFIDFDTDGKMVESG